MIAEQIKKAETQHGQLLTIRNFSVKQGITFQATKNSSKKPQKKNIT